jgi:UDP-hydrolysing UDP-N-acetyl-D-glucosamine 2-epimerase
VVPDPLRNILIIATSRGDARGLSQVALALAAADRASVRVLLTDAAAAAWNPSGSHLLNEVPTRIVPCGFSEARNVNELAHAAHALALAAIDAAASAPTDIVVLMGDRHELLPLAHGLLLHGVPIGHQSGGDVTEGVFDDGVRHALTKLSHLHFCTTEQAAQRVLQMGEEPWRVTVTGEPALDGLVEAAGRISPWQAGELGFPLERPLALVTYHPPTLTPELLEPELEAIVTSLDEARTIIATHPKIVARLQRWSAHDPTVHVLPELGPLYASLLARADVVVGNSSSGIVEAPTFKTPVVNVGDRQRGRVHAINVIDVPGDRTQVREAIHRALDPSFRASLEGLINPYGDGHASERIRDILLEADRASLWHKRFVDQSRGPA